MIFILHEIKLWFKDEGSTPKSYFFEPNKINVVTGGATTGKTSFWSIIDYCLLSDKVSIAEPISDSVSWYGINFTINGKKISIVRASPTSGNPILAVCYNEGGFPIDLVANKEISQVKSILDLEFGISDDLRFPHGKAKGGTHFNLSFRYFLLFNLLSEDIIGTSKTYFDTTFFGKDEYENALAHIFDLVIGVNGMQNLKANERLSKVNAEIRKIQNQQKSNQKKQKDFEFNTRVLLARSKEFGFVDYNEQPESLLEGLEILESVVSGTKKVTENAQLFSELDQLNQQRSHIKVQLNAITRYKTEFEQYNRTLNKCADSLQPIEYLNQNLSNQLVESYETKLFVDSLEASLRNIRNNLSKNVAEPKKVSGDTKVLQEELKIVEARISQLRSVQKEFVAEAQRFVNLGEIKFAYEQLLSGQHIELIDTVKLNELDDERANLEKIPKDNQEIKFSMKELLNSSIQRNFNLLSSLPAYGTARTHFNTSEMVLQLFPAGQIFPLDNVGSKSNYMMMHLCFYLGLHEHMISVGQVHVPQFLFIDQPSIPYYTDGDNMDNEDKTKLLDAFSLINSFVAYIVETKKSSFQIFLVEHAPESYWKDNNLEYFHTVDKFVEGKGLIPHDVYKGK